MLGPAFDLGRRRFAAAWGTLAAGAAVSPLRVLRMYDERGVAPPAFSVVPVVGDGRWIWTRPPQGAVGYLEPRRFRLSIGVELVGRGNPADVAASTPVPDAFPEQTIDDERIETFGTEAAIDRLAPGARRFTVAAAQLARGQAVRAVAHFDLTLRKQYQAFERSRFPAEQRVPHDVRVAYLGDSPGIQSRAPQTLALLKQLQAEAAHPWDLARSACNWVRANIRPRLGRYTSVTTALDRREGDCEEMAGVFTAVCRAAGIPARLVWIPNHVWAEFHLTDADGRGHWIPAHTACYPWFGWTGVHELVLQKGDRLRLPGEATVVRLQPDRTRAVGGRAEARFTAELTPLPDVPSGDDGSSAEAGPGARRKTPTGEWQVVGTHPLDRYARR